MVLKHPQFVGCHWKNSKALKNNCFWTWKSRLIMQIDLYRCSLMSQDSSLHFWLSIWMSRSSIPWNSTNALMKPLETPKPDAASWSLHALTCRQQPCRSRNVHAFNGSYRFWSIFFCGGGGGISSWVVARFVVKIVDTFLQKDAVQVPWPKA